MHIGPELGKPLVVLGLLIVAVGLVLIFGDKLPLDRFPLGRLPGDIVIDRPGFKFYFPVVTCIVVSLVLTLLFWLFRK